MIIYATSSFAQQNDKLTYFRINNDTITFYLNNVGDITIKSKAEYFRKSQIDPQSFVYKGNVEDYYLNNQKAFECFFKDGNLTGKTKSFYQNGQLKYQGFYKNSYRDSLWNFYYKNGKIEKNVIYKTDEPYIVDYYKEDGKCAFSNGNGKYSGTILAFKQTTDYQISGNVKNGRMEGKWNWRGHGSSAVESFENGKFLTGSSYGLIYTKDPKVTLTGFNLHDNVDLFKFIIIPDTKEKSFLFSQMLKYKDSNKLSKNVYT